MKNLSAFEMENYKKYHTPGCPNYMRNKINAINLRVANSWKHEEAKCRYAYELMKAGHKIITEAAQNGTKFIRDLVNISTGQIYEFETDPKRAARFKTQKEVKVVKLWD